MKNLKYFLLLIFAFVIGCSNELNQVFIPDIQSGENATEAVFVPAVQSTDREAASETQMLPAIIDQTSNDNETEAVKEETSGTPNADVIFVKAKLSENGSWTFNVTVSHPDTGWDDYADGWDVLLPDGTVLKPNVDSDYTRLLLHPHVDEQPFTRSQSGIEIPSEVDLVTVRAHDIVDGFGGKEVVVDLTADSGPDFEIQR